MNNIWLHRISWHGEVSHPLLKQQELAIGFSDFSTQEFIDDVLQKGWSAVDKTCDKIWGGRPRTRHNIWRFVHEMKQGDWVVVPLWENFAIYELVGDKPLPISQVQIQGLKDWSGHPVTLGDDGLLYREGSSDAVDLGFFWKVKLIQKGVSRDKFADRALTARMKTRMTNAHITDLRSSVDTALRAYAANRPINLHSQITEQAIPAVLDILQTSLNPDKLERLVKWYFKRIGASDVYIPAKNEADKEGDADVVATFESIKTIIYVQVKFHQGETSSWASEQVTAYKESRGSSVDDYSKLCWVISTADSYSPESVQYSKESDVRLLNGKQFVEMLLEAGINGLGEALDK